MPSCLVLRLHGPLRAASVSLDLRSGSQTQIPSWVGEPGHSGRWLMSITLHLGLIFQARDVPVSPKRAFVQ